MDQYTSDLLTPWRMLQYVGLFDEARIDILALQMLSDSDIDTLINPLGDRLKFKANLALWKEELKKSDMSEKQKDATELGLNESLVNLLVLDFNIKSPQVQPGISGNEGEELVENFVQRILKKTYEGRAIIAQGRKLLTPDLRRELSNLIVRDFLEEDPSRTVSNPTFLRLAHEIGEIFTEESPAVFYAPYIKANNFQPKRNCSGLLYSTYTARKRKLRNLGILPKSSRSSSSQGTGSSSTTSSVTSLGIDLETLEEGEADIVQEKLIILEGSTSDAPWQNIQALWEDTTKARLRYLYYEKGSLKNYLDQFPILKKPLGYQLLVQDFERIFPNHINSLTTTFETYSQRIIEIAQNKVASNKDAHVKLLNLDIDIILF